MIKIEFKEAVHTGTEVSMFKYATKDQLDDFEYFTRPSDNYVDKVIPYIPTSDIWLDRSFILNELRISKEQDEENQIDWNWIYIEDNWKPKDFDGFK